jgi:hypothetical protein
MLVHTLSGLQCVRVASAYDVQMFPPLTDCVARLQGARTPEPTTKPLFYPPLLLCFNPGRYDYRFFVGGLLCSSGVKSTDGRKINPLS